MPSYKNRVPLQQLDVKWTLTFFFKELFLNDSIDLQAITPQIQKFKEHSLHAQAAMCRLPYK